MKEIIALLHNEIFFSMAAVNSGANGTADWLRAGNGVRLKYFWVLVCACESTFYFEAVELLTVVG